MRTNTPKFKRRLNLVKKFHETFKNYPNLQKPSTTFKNFQKPSKTLHNPDWKFLKVLDFLEVLSSFVFGFVGSFLEVFASFWKFSQVFASFWKFLEVFGSFWKFAFGSFQKFVEGFGSFSKFLAVCCISGSCGLSFVLPTTPGLARNLAPAAFSYFRCFCCLVLPITCWQSPSLRGNCRFPTISFQILPSLQEDTFLGRCLGCINDLKQSKNPI